MSTYDDTFLDRVIPLCENYIHQVGVIRNVSALQLTQSQQNYVCYFEVQSYSGGRTRRDGTRGKVEKATVLWTAYGKVAKAVQEIPGGTLVMVRGEHWQPSGKTTIKQLQRIARCVGAIGVVTNGAWASGGQIGETLEVEED